MTQVPTDFVIRADGSVDAGMLRQYAERRLAFALRFLAVRARHVIVRLDDINGPRRGIDSRCGITLWLRDGRRVDAAAVTAWPFASVTLAASRLHEAVRRDIGKARTTERRQARVRWT